MGKIRVHEIAKELGLQSKEMVDILQNMGLDVKNHMSTLEESQANWVKKQLKTGGRQEKNKAGKRDSSAARSLENDTPSPKRPQQPAQEQAKRVEHQGEKKTAPRPVQNQERPIRPKDRPCGRL